MNPLISVIVPAHNATNTIEKCLDSLLNQTLKNIEIIVINDCSDDDTLNKLEKYQSRIIIINNDQKSGPAASRNKGLEVAKGQYIGFVDADDSIDLKMYEMMISKMNDEVDLVACSRINVTKKGHKEIINLNETDDPKKFTSTTNYIWDKLFKKTIIDQYNLRFPENYSYAEDFFFGIQYKYYANKMVILKDPFYYYLYDSAGSITNSYKRNLLDIIHVLEETLDFFRNKDSFNKYEDELVKVCAGFYIRRIREFSRFNDKKLQREFVHEFLNFFKRNFKNYKYQINTFNSNNNKFYRSNYLLMLVYIEFISFKRKLSKRK